LLLAERFECPVIVHNTAQVARSDGSLRSAVRRLATLPGRRRLAHVLNDRVATAVEAANRPTFEHVHLLDETSWIRAHDEAQVGRYVHAPSTSTRPCSGACWPAPPTRRAASAG